MSFDPNYVIWPDQMKKALERARADGYGAVWSYTDHKRLAHVAFGVRANGQVTYLSIMDFPDESKKYLRELERENHGGAGGADERGGAN